MTFNTACNRRLPFVSPFTAPPDFFVTSRPELLRLFIVIAFFTPLSSNFRIQRCKIILSRNCQAASAVRAAVSLAAIAHARSPGMFFLNYAAAKAGVIGLTKTWAKEFARKGAAVRVNCIAPGYTMTDMLKTVPQDLLDKFADMTMLKRLGRPEEIASAALFLVSEEASYVTGQVLSVNGGMRL